MGNLISYWAQTIVALNTQLFSGSPSAIESLSLLISDGHVLGNVSLPGDDAIQHYIEQAVYAWLIPKAWSLSNEGYRPVILDSGEPCTTSEENEKKKICWATAIC